ncbi:MAG: DUF3325 family protein [Pseudomonadaceae bacterium]
MTGSLLCLVFSACYAGMLALCLGMERHWKQLAAGAPATWRRLCRPLGLLLLVVALLLSAQIWPAGMALVGWLGTLSLGGLCLLLLLPYAPRLALWLPLLGVLLAPLLIPG